REFLDDDHDWSTQDVEDFKKLISDPTKISSADILRMEDHLLKLHRKAKDGEKHGKALVSSNPFRRILEDVTKIKEKVPPGIHVCLQARRVTHPNEARKETIAICMKDFKRRLADL